MKTLREIIKEASDKRVAVGHFNISNLEGLHGIYQAAKKLGLPVIIGVSEGEEKFVGREEVVALIRTLRERDNYPIYLNADHHSSFESVKACIDAGFDMAIIDCELKHGQIYVKVALHAMNLCKEINHFLYIDRRL
jgi:fructose-bisphosphate aldolase class II/6-phospho-5-dehydro-2-deoxy-D-gluconate aldolase